jgi:hypothetical protein
MEIPKLRLEIFLSYLDPPKISNASLKCKRGKGSIF